jgi:hypothetical protein
MVRPSRPKCNAVAGMKFRDIDERYTAEEIYAYLWAL